MSRKIVSGLALSLASCVLCVGGLLAADLYLHAKYANAFPNVRGYAGQVLGSKAPGELRLAVLGGSTAYGYGAGTDRSFPAYLGPMLVERLGRPVTVANLAYNNESAVCFAPTLEQYAYLQPDAVVLYTGYNDLSPSMYYRQPSDCFRNRSVIFLKTGYMPILPSYLVEKYFQLRYGSVDRGYREGDSVPSLLQLPLSLVLGQPTMDPQAAREPVDDLAAAQMQRYVDLVTGVVAGQLGEGRAVFVVTQPYVSESHRAQQTRLREALEPFRDSPYFRYINLGSVVDVQDPELAPDGMHLTAEGNAIIAAALADPIADTLRGLQ